MEKQYWEYEKERLGKIKDGLWKELFELIKIVKKKYEVKELSPYKAKDIKPYQDGRIPDVAEIDYILSINGRKEFIKTLRDLINEIKRRLKNNDKK